jgi:glycosyltransferase involved in cell wall biosynthesis
MNIAYISRNIPVPNIKENDIILRILNGLEQYDNTVNIDCYFPKETFPNIPFIDNPRIKAISKLPSVFKSHDIKITSLDYIRLPGFNFSYRLVNSFKYLNKKLFSEFSKYDLIHCHNIMPDGKMGLTIKQKFNIPLIITVRNGDLDKINKLSKSSKLYKSYIEILKNTDCIIVHNYSTELFVKDFGLEYISIPHGIEENLIIKDEIKKENIILFVGNMIPRKNLRMVCNAFMKNENENWKLIILGDGKEFDDIKKLTKGIENIELLGKVPRKEVINYMQLSKVFVLPSDNETFGIVYLEACASKCLVIGKKYTGIYGWLEDNREALFVNEEIELSNLFKDIFLEKIDIENISKNGYEKLNSKLLWKQQIEKYVKIYKGLY